jgi:hypothetical protein
MKLHISPKWRIRLEGTIPIAAPASAVWGQMRDVEWFLTRDPLHARIRRTDGLPASAPWPRAPIILSHRILGIGPDRVGRILGWKEGRGYAVSDLSRRRPDRAFPHILAYRLRPAGENACSLILTVRGQWTATWLPRPIVQLWLRWISFATHTRLAADLADFAAWHRRRDSQHPANHTFRKSKMSCTAR